jgi:hypothetical protein
MPEFEEKSSFAIADETSIEAPSGAGDGCMSVVGGVTMSNEERSRCALKRGRMPASAAQKKANQKVVHIDEVCQDAIGTRKDKPSVVRKSTTIVEKNMNSGKKSCSETACQCNKHAEKSAKHENGHGQKCAPCKCEGGMFRKFVKKFLCFFGLCKDVKREQQQPRACRHRSRTQRRSGTRDGNRQVN